MLLQDVSRNQKGLVQSTTIPLVIMTFIAVIMTGVSIWSYSQFTDQRNNVDARVDEAVSNATQTLEANLEAEFEEAQKSPFQSYKGSATLGSVEFDYPKTWSSYLRERDSGSSVGIDGYFHPKTVPHTDSGVPYALRLNLDSSTFDSEVKSYQKRVDSGDAESSAIEVNGAKGVRIDGEISSGTNGSIVLLPLRDKTLQLFTESTEYLSDFNKVVESLTFIP